ncbi:hypothetical protein CHS0354_037835 [Potamilus streckersoni]|uniref:Helicase ATP-binding domain-containing protein n=1 Tax=Potamilus streckersoni TaxID=2493646 RepID=A0AAE0SJ80_9BIVA|nr:hypothetical protein CHS0354_037835 [Potamilus streckersoni]
MDGFDDDDDELLSAVEINVENNGGRVSDEEKTVVVPEDFSFPFEAYDIQKDFMKELYKCLELGNVGIFESPTGTGKSLSLICGALRWLKDYQKRQQEELDSLLAASGTLDVEKENQQKANGNTELDWIAEFAEKKKGEENIKRIKEMQEQRLKKEEKLKEIKDRIRNKKRKLDTAFDDLMEGAADDVRKAYEAEIKKEEVIEAARLDKNGIAKEDEDLLLDDYCSDEEAEEKNEEDEIEDHIYYCSRTHSQLSQFVREVMKSPYGEDIKVISLGSRQNLCINSAVKQMKSLSLINDACLDLQRNKSSKGSKKMEPSTKRQRSAGGGTCPFYKQDNVQAFKERALVDVKDVEHLVDMGKELKACPYYGTRLAIPDAELVVLPYNTLLHQSTREACGIKLKGNIVVIDEAHNLLETINNVYSTEISGAQVARASSQLGQYESRYRTRLKAVNLMYIKQILHILSRLANSMGGMIGVPADKQTISSPVASLCTINDFLFRSQLDNINLFKVLRFCKGSQISRKLYGFTERYQNEVKSSELEKKETARSAVTNFLKSISSKGENSSSQTTSGKPTDSGSPEFEAVVMSSPLMHIEGFLQALTNADKDGRIVINKQSLFSKSSIKFLHLNPAVHFATVLQEARAVIVAGGTMQPADEFRDQLFHAAGVTSSRIQEFSCGHVIPSNQLLPIALSTGPTGIQLDFTFQNRMKSQLLDELGRLLCNVCNVVPGGVVCFFPSYDYEKLVFSHWEMGGVITKLEGKKKLYREPKRAGQVEQVLGEYSSCIKKCGTWSTSKITGAVLFCVVGGKMSEGINFSDELGRCVIMVGLPYPNRHSPELKEKMDYLNANFPKDKDGHLPGQVHYENLCMKAVNQSIGRAIRHRGDYATILLLDGRYRRPSTVSKLPGWISKHLQKMDRFGPAIAAISRFFGDKKKP